jgi:hypothetical protein
MKRFIEAPVRAHTGVARKFEYIELEVVFQYDHRLNNGRGSRRRWQLRRVIVRTDL